MQNDLISRSELLKWIPFWGGDIESMIEFIANMETAYDVEKVVEQLKEATEVFTSFETMHIKYAIPKHKAIEIVKGGGEDAE